MKLSRGVLGVTTVAFLCSMLFTGDRVYGQTFQYTKQGFSMRLTLDNKGTMGRASYPGGLGSGFPCDSLGLQYPIGQPFEHIFGAGLWVGGILDTSNGPIPTYVRGVTTG